MPNDPSNAHVDRFMEEQMFEEDVKAVLMMLRPNRQERLQGWQEYRTGGSDFRVTISWKPEFARTTDDDTLVIPHLADVLEAIVVGSARAQDDLTADQEFGIYRRVVSEVYQRLHDLESQYQ